MPLPLEFRSIAAAGASASAAAAGIAHVYRRLAVSRARCTSVHERGARGKQQALLLASAS